MAKDVIEFQITRDEDILVASWNDPMGLGGITTQGASLVELVSAIKEAVLCHFDEGKAPQKVTLHFVENPEVSLLEAA